MIQVNLAPTPVKRCTKCGAPGPFFRQASARDGLQTKCNVCSTQTNRAWRSRNRERLAARQRAWNAAHPHKGRSANLKRYGLTSEQRDAMFAWQDGLCALCRRPMQSSGNGRDSVHVDHEHGSGRVRALLHSSCNRGLGCFEDDPERLRLAIEYLAARRG